MLLERNAFDSIAFFPQCTEFYFSKIPVVTIQYWYCSESFFHFLLFIIKALNYRTYDKSTPKKIPCTRILFCLVRTGANFAILVEMIKFKFSKKNKENKLI